MSYSIEAHMDNTEWPHIERALRRGARLIDLPKFDRLYLRVSGNISTRSLSRGRVRELIASGSLYKSGKNTYALRSGLAAVDDEYEKSTVIGLGLFNGKSPSRIAQETGFDITDIHQFSRAMGEI